MSCRRFHEALAGHAAGADLDPAAAAHLAGCGTCGTRLELQRRLLTEVDAELERALAVTAPPELVAKVTARAGAPRPRPMTWQPAAAWLGLAAAAAIALAAVLGDPAATAPPPSPRSGAPTVVSVPIVPPAGTMAAPTRRSVVPRPVAVRPAGVKAPASTGLRFIEEPAAIVRPDQARALARLRELLDSGRLDEKMLPPPAPDQVAELTVTPLEIPAIKVADVEIAGRTAPPGGLEQH